MEAKTCLVEQIDDVATGEAARMERVKHRISQRDVAQVMGVSVMMISLLERGLYKWTEDRIKRFNGAIAFIVDASNVGN